MSWHPGEVKFKPGERERVYAEIVEASKAGEKATTIAARVGISRGMVSRIIRKHIPRAPKTEATLRRQLSGL